MTDTLFRDTSYYQDYDVNEIIAKTGERVVSIRSNDGTFVDPDFQKRLAQAKYACDTGRLDCFGVYFVFEENWQADLATFKAAVGKPHPKMFIILDVENWKGRITGDHSSMLNAMVSGLVSWLRSFRSPLARVLDRVLGRQRKRVVVYGNAGDLNNIFPKRGSIKVALADYSGNPAFPNELWHQFSSTFTGDGLPAGDINSADGRTPLQFARQVGCYQLSWKDGMALLKSHGLKPPASSK